jgi:hypothetical protein
MEQLEFVLCCNTFPVDMKQAMLSCDALADSLDGSRLIVRSTVTEGVLRLFISAVHGEEIELTNENIDGLSALCNEFQFRRLARRLAVFMNTPIYRLEQRFTALEARLKSLTNTVTSLETAHQSDLGRLARLESEVLALRTTPPPSEQNTSSPPALPTQHSTPGSAPAAPSQQSTQGPSANEISDPAPTFPASPVFIPLGWNSAIVRDFPKVFEDFKEKEFTLLWRGGRDGFRALDFHSRCDGHPNTLTVILDTNGNIFGGFTPVEWESSKLGKYARYEAFWKSDPSRKSFLFTLRNPDNVRARRFALMAGLKDTAIKCDSNHGPIFGGENTEFSGGRLKISVSDKGNTNNSSFTGRFGSICTNDTGLDAHTFFTGSEFFQVKEIEVFAITE